MIKLVIRGCLRLDTWLQDRLGRPYNVALGIGLIIEICRRLGEVPHHMESAPRLFGVVLVVLFETALLIHQIGALWHHFGPRHNTDEKDAESPKA